MNQVKTYSYPEARSIVVCGDIHGDFNTLIDKMCIQYQMTDTLLIVAGDCGFGFEKQAYYDIVRRRNSARLYGLDFEGYATPNQLTFFHDFCINQYGVAFHYDGNNYEAEFTNDGPILTDLSTGEAQGPFEDAVSLLENSKLKGKAIVAVVDKLENVVLH